MCVKTFGQKSRNQLIFMDPLNEQTKYTIFPHWQPYQPFSSIRTVIYPHLTEDRQQKTYQRSKQKQQTKQHRVQLKWHSLTCWMKSTAWPSWTAPWPAVPRPDGKRKPWRAPAPWRTPARASSTSPTCPCKSPCQPTLVRLPSHRETNGRRLPINGRLVCYC